MNELSTQPSGDITSLEKLKRTSVSAEIDPSATLEECMQMLRTLITCQDSIQFWIGDMLNEMDHRFGDKFTEAAKITGLDIGTLANYSSVSYCVQKSLRNEKLEWSYHKEISRLEPKDQKKWLGLAEKEGLKVRELRESIRQNKVVRMNQIADQSGVNSGLKTPHGAIMQLSMWERHTLNSEKITWSEEAVHQFRAEIIKPMDEMTERFKSKLQTILEEAQQ